MRSRVRSVGNSMPGPKKPVTKLTTAPASSANSINAPANHPSAGPGFSRIRSTREASASRSTLISGTSVVPHAGVDNRVQEVLHDVDEDDEQDEDEHQRADQRH